MPVTTGLHPDRYTPSVESQKQPDLTMKLLMASIITLPRLAARDTWYPIGRSMPLLPTCQQVLDTPQRIGTAKTRLVASHGINRLGSQVHIVA